MNYFSIKPVALTGYMGREITPFTFGGNQSACSTPKNESKIINGDVAGGFKASKAEVYDQHIKDNEESMRRFYAIWSSL
jgi:hypothetical protein